MNEESKAQTIVETTEHLRNRIAQIDAYYYDLKSGLSRYMAREVAMRLGVQCLLSRKNVLNLADHTALESREAPGGWTWVFNDALVEWAEKPQVMIVYLNKSHVEKPPSVYEVQIQRYQFEYRLTESELSFRNDYALCRILSGVDTRILYETWDDEKQQAKQNLDNEND